MSILLALEGPPRFKEAYLFSEKRAITVLIVQMVAGEESFDDYGL